MDDRTIRYYDDNAEEVFARYDCAVGGVREYFRLAFPPGAGILDIGSGSGRDLGILLAEEYEAYGAEPSARLRALYLSGHPEMGTRIYAAALPELSAHIPKKSTASSAPPCCSTSRPSGSSTPPSTSATS